MNNHISGLKFYDKDNRILCQAGYHKDEHNFEIQLLDGERLLQIRSTAYDNTEVNRGWHCNMTFVLGRLEWCIFI